MQDISGFKELIKSPKKIVITTHANPDADALGSSLGLYHLLIPMGHEVQVIVPNDYPDFLRWMPGNETVLIFEKSVKEATDIMNEAEVICCLDFSGLNRIKGMGPVVREAKAKKVLIDHHLDPEDFADFSMWDTSAAATAELVFDLIQQLGMKEAITKDMAEVIYAGIMTDTGSFKHPSTTSKVHRTVADLIDLGADISKVNRNIYDTNSLNRLRFMGYAFLKKLIVKSELKVAYFVITADDYRQFALKSGDTEGLVNYALSIDGIIMATFIIEREDEVKLSFRSVGDYPVNIFASEYFNGGGHKNASGGSSTDTLADTVAKFESVITTFNKKHLLT